MCIIILVLPVGAVMTEKIVFTRWDEGQLGQVYIMNPDGTGQTPLPNTSGGYYPSLSPDGTKVAYTAQPGSEMGMPMKIFVMNLDGTDLTPLTNSVDGNWHPVWSSDGTKIAFVSDRDRDANNGAVISIYMMNADGSGQTRLTHGPYDDYPTWSPDGTKIAFHSWRPDNYNTDIFVVNTDGIGLTRLTTTGNNYCPAWSPDGTKIAFTTYTTSETIFIMNADGSGQTSLSSNGGGITWSPDGSKIAFSSDRTINGGDSDIYVMNADGTNEKRITYHLGPDQDPMWGLVIDQNIKPPSQAIQDTITLINTMNLPKGTDTSLISKLDNAIKSLDKNNANAAKNQLEATINEINAQKDKKIAGEQANTLIAALQKIIQYL